MVNNSTNINKNHLSPKLIEWWSTIPPISTKITSHLNSLSDGQQFHQYQQKSPLTTTHWVMVNNSTNINTNHLSPQLIEWCQQFHQYQPKSPLTSTQWVMVNNSTNINKNQQKSPLTITHWVIVNNSTNINNNHLSPQLIKWWSTIPPPISTKITPLFNSLSDGQQFHQYQQKSPLTLTHWLMVNNFTNINKNHLLP